MSLFRCHKMVLLQLIALTACAWLADAGAQVAQGQNEAIYMYRGSDRDVRLLEKARLEGKVVLYTSMATTESVPLAHAFEKKYGVKVELWRAVSEKVVQRAVAEGLAKRFAVDVIETNGPEMEMLTRENLFSSFHSPYIEDLPPVAVPSHRKWISDRLNFFVVAFNTNLIRREELPKTYEGFLDPKWKGKIGVEATDSEWLATITKQWGPERGQDFFRRLAEMKPDVRKGHNLLSELVSAGEVPVGLTVYNAYIESMKRKGAPVDWAPVDPVVGRPQGIGVARNAPHPHAALLFADFVLSQEGQELLSSLGRIPTSLKVKTHMNKFSYTMIDMATVLDESKKWEKIWNDLFLGK